MTKTSIAGVLIALAAPAFLWAFQGEAEEKESPAGGAGLFRTNCAPCHGVDGKGEGPVADQLRFVPADLTGIARRNGGKFPTDKVRRIVDGRNAAKGHGATDMPVWGDAFKSPEAGFDEKQAQDKIAQVVAYLASIQSKAKR